MYVQLVLIHLTASQWEGELVFVSVCFHFSWMDGLMMDGGWKTNLRLFFLTYNKLIIIILNINDSKLNLRVSRTVQRSLTGDFINTGFCMTYS